MFVKSKILRSTHAFATRMGGISTLPHTRELNLAFGRGDDSTTVLKNFELFAAQVGFDPKSTVSLPQIHSDIIYKVSEKDRGKGYYITDGISSGDGYITADRGVTLGIKTADCVPILFEAEKDGEIIAIGAVHAGWRGSVAGIAPKCVKMMCEEYGIKPQSIRAAIGPCIRQCCYEVGDDLYSAVSETLGNMTKNFFKDCTDKGDKYYLDLPALNRYLLESAGIPADNIDDLGICTCCENEKFYSHRYTRGLRGTMLNVICL